MIADVDVCGVFVPGLLVLALTALVITVVIVRLLALVGLRRVLPSRAVIELSTFAIIFALLVQRIPLGGSIP